MYLEPVLGYFDELATALLKCTSRQDAVDYVAGCTVFHIIPIIAQYFTLFPNRSRG